MMALSPRCIVLFADGCVVEDSTLGLVDCPALDQTAKEGCSGQLALRSLPDGSTEAQRSIFELRQLLDLNDANINGGSIRETEGEKGNFKSLKERFMGMSAQLYSDLPTAAALGSQAGFSSQPLPPSKRTDSLESLPDSTSFADQLLTALGLTNSTGTKVDGEIDNQQPDPSAKADSSAAETQDLVLVHLHADSQNQGRASETVKQNTDATASGSGSTETLQTKAEDCLTWLDSLVKAIRDRASKDTAIAARLLLVIVLSHHARLCAEHGVGASASGSEKKIEGAASPAGLLGFRPLQTYQQKDGEAVTNLREHYRALVVYNSHGLTRRDDVQCLREEEIISKGANLVILADKFLSELAFKVGRAPKYGA